MKEEQKTLTTNTEEAGEKRKEKRISETWRARRHEFKQVRDRPKCDSRPLSGTHPKSQDKKRGKGCLCPALGCIEPPRAIDQGGVKRRGGGLPAERGRRRGAERKQANKRRRPYESGSSTMDGGERGGMLETRFDNHHLWGRGTGMKEGFESERFHLKCRH